MTKLQQQIVDLYLDYVNNFISVKCFADHYDITCELAEAIINNGRLLHNDTNI